MIRSALLILCVVACGGTKATGTVADRPFSGNQAWARFSDRELQLSIEENTNRCQSGKATGAANRYRLIARLSKWDGSAIIPASGPGVYTVLPKYCRDNAGKLFSDCSVSAKEAPTGSLYAIAEYERDGEQTALAVLSGSVTVSDITPAKPGSIDGSFSVFVDPDSKLSGNFSSVICDVSE